MGKCLHSAATFVAADQDYIANNLFTSYPPGGPAIVGNSLPAATRVGEVSIFRTSTRRILFPDTPPRTKLSRSSWRGLG